MRHQRKRPTSTESGSSAHIPNVIMVRCPLCGLTRRYKIGEQIFPGSNFFLDERFVGGKLPSGRGAGRGKGRGIVKTIRTLTMDDMPQGFKEWFIGRLKEMITAIEKGEPLSPGRR